MDAISLTQILEWTGGALSGPGAGRDAAETAALRVVTDSRVAQAGDCFVALTGERLDGHAYIDAAVKAGAGIVVYSPARYAPPPGAAGAHYVAVPDTLEAYQAIARGYRTQYSIPVVGVTGSNGKTTTKELAAAVLSQMGEVVATEKNYNNDVGLPMTLLRIESRHKAAVVEMGMRGTGEIARLARIARPTVGVITNVGPVHVGILKSVDAVAEAKAELIRELPSSGTAVLNADDPRVRAMAGFTRAAAVTYGIEEEADVQAREIESHGLMGTEFTLAWPGASAKVRLPLPGRHHVYNALAAAAVGRALGLEINAVAEGLRSGRTARMRTEVVRLGEGVVLIDDAYNSSPLSAKAALELLSECGGARRVAVLGDMLELGEQAADLHVELGRQAARAGVDALVAVGEFAAHVVHGAREAGGKRPEATICADAEEAVRTVGAVVKPGDLVLVKGSRGVALERVSDALKAKYGPGGDPEREAGVER